MAKTTDALTILDGRIGADADLRQMIAKEPLKAQITRLEDADVDRDALFLLYRIAAALGHALDMRLVPVSRAHRRAATTAGNRPAGTAPAWAWHTSAKPCGDLTTRMRILLARYMGLRCSAGCARSVPHSKQPLSSSGSAAYG